MTDYIINLYATGDDMTIHRHNLKTHNTHFSIYIPDEDNNEVKSSKSLLRSRNYLQDPIQKSLLKSRRLVIRAHGSEYVNSSLARHLHMKRFNSNRFNSMGTEIRFLNDEGFFLENKVSADALGIAPLSSFVKASEADNMVLDYNLSGDHLQGPDSCYKFFSNERDRNFLDNEIKKNINSAIVKGEGNQYKLGSTTIAVMDMLSYFHGSYTEASYLPLVENYSSGSARGQNILEARPFNTLHIEKGRMRLSELFKWLKENRIEVKEIVVSCCRGTLGLDQEDDNNKQKVNNDVLYHRSYHSGDLQEKYKADVECRMAILNETPPFNILGVINTDTMPDGLYKEEKSTKKVVCLNAYNGYVYYESLRNYCCYTRNYEAALKVCLIVFKRFFYNKECYQAMRLRMTEAVMEFTSNSNAYADKIEINPLENTDFMSKTLAAYQKLLELEKLPASSILYEWCYIFSTLAIKDYLTANQGQIDLNGKGANTFWWHTVFGSQGCQTPKINISFPVCSVQELNFVGIDRSDEMYNWCQNSVKRVNTKRRHSFSI